jgi:hypothetical protein
MSEGRPVERVGVHEVAAGFLRHRALSIIRDVGVLAERAS